MPDSIPDDEKRAAAALEETRALTQSLSQYLSEDERQLYNRALGRAAPLIRAATQDPGLGPRDAFVLSLLAKALSMLGQVRDEVREMRGEST